MIVPPPPRHAIAFADAHHGWVGGERGLLGTSDGRRFRLEARAPIVGISALDARHAWAITGDGFVLRTINGRGWSRLGARHLFHVQFVNSARGFGLTRDGVVVKSDGGGRSWPQLSTRGLMQSECFVSARDGWVARGGTVWTTHDGGSSWSRRRFLADRQGYPIPELGCRDREAWVLFHEGVAAGSEAYVVFRSGDAGRTWRPVLANLDHRFVRRVPRIGPGYSGPFSVLANGRAVFVGVCGPCGRQPTDTFARSADGGRAWKRSTPFDGIEVDAISFVDPRRGFAVTTSPRGRPREAWVWGTNDGGRRWHRLLRSSLLGSR